MRQPCARLFLNPTSKNVSVRRKMNKAEWDNDFLARVPTDFSANRPGHASGSFVDMSDADSPPKLAEAEPVRTLPGQPEFDALWHTPMAGPRPGAIRFAHANRPPHPRTSVILSLVVGVG